jgi:lysophospholipase L1-like esterase
LRKQLGLGNDRRSQWEYWAHREHPGLRFRNCGGRGQRTEEIARRLESCTDGADAVVIQGGINDLRGGVRPQTILANLRAMVRAANRSGLEVAVADLLPYNPDPGTDATIERLNRRIAAMARNSGATPLRFHRTLEDPLNPAAMKPEWTADGVHPSVEGYRRLGELAFRRPR